MTIINCVPVETLTDEHLLAEYKEITRPFNKMVRRIDLHGEDHAISNIIIPDRYVLGSGHEAFFFDKLEWLFKRYFIVYDELLDRGFNLDSPKFFSITRDIKTRLSHTKYWCDWNPTPEDMYLNMARLVKRTKLVSVKEELSSNV